MSAPAPLKVGIMGSAGIAKKGWGAMHMAGLQVVAVASRSQEKAQAFIDACNGAAPMATVPKAVGGYDALLVMEDVEAVYIPLPTMLHKEWVNKALAKGKHVVMEKPVTVSMEDLAEMQAAARANKLVLLDGTMLTHGKRCDAIRAKVASGAIGSVSSIHASFTFPADGEFLKDNIRVNPEMDPLGSVGDVGWYCIRHVLEVFPHWTPVAAVKCETLRSINGVNVAFSGEIVFETNSTSQNLPKTEDIKVQSFEGEEKSTVTLHFHTSFVESHTQAFRILGSTGHIELDDFCLPVQNREKAEFNISSNSIDPFNVVKIVHVSNKETVKVEEHSEYQETMLWKNFQTLARTGVSETGRSPLHYQETTWKTQSAVCAALSSANDGRKSHNAAVFSTK